MHSRLQLWRPVCSVHEATAVGGCSISFDFIVEAFGLGLEVKFGQSVRLAVSCVGLRYCKVAADAVLGSKTAFSHAPCSL